MISSFHRGPAASRGRYYPFVRNPCGWIERIAKNSLKERPPLEEVEA